MRKTKEKLFRQFVTIALFTLTLLQACGEATSTPAIPTVTPIVPALTTIPTPTVTPTVPTFTSSPIFTATPTLIIGDILATVYRADTGQIEGKDWQANDSLKVNWIADKHVLFAGMNITPANILTLKIFGPFPSNQEAKKITINEPNPIIATEFDPEIHKKEPFITDLKLPDNLSPGYYSLLCFSEMGSYGDTSITVFKVVK